MLHKDDRTSETISTMSCEAPVSPVHGMQVEQQSHQAVEDSDNHDHDQGENDEGNVDHDPLEPVSETMSLASAIYRGYMENGRKYQTLREGEYWMPCDEKYVLDIADQTAGGDSAVLDSHFQKHSLMNSRQFESMAAAHLQFCILDSDRDNSLFYSQIPADAQHVLDIGTGDASWAVEVADEFPDLTVHGVDLFPPPPEMVPPNCILEVDDVCKPWTWRPKFDLVHLRSMIAAFTNDEWDDLYAQIYDNLAPGGWIEQCEPSIFIECDDGSLPPDSILNAWGKIMARCNENAGRSADTYDTMRDRIERAGFINIQQKDYKCPIGGWHEDPTMRDAGIIGKEVFKSGAEGWVMWLLTNHGLPEPWTADQVRMFVARAVMDLGHDDRHVYHRARRVWAQKPLKPRPVSTRAADEAGADTETGAEQSEDDGAEQHGEAEVGQAQKKKKKRKRNKKKKKAGVEEEPQAAVV